jgi:hypothetical protein
MKLSSIFPSVFASEKKRSTKAIKDKTGIGKQVEGVENNLIRTNELLSLSIQTQRQQNELLSSILQELGNQKDSGFDFSDLLDMFSLGRKSAAKETAKGKTTEAAKGKGTAKAENKPKIYESAAEAKAEGGGKYYDKNGKPQEITKTPEGKWQNRLLKQEPIPEIKPPAAGSGATATAEKGFLSGLKRFGGEALGTAAKYAKPLAIVLAIYEAFQRIKQLDPKDPDLRKNLIKIVGDLSARFGFAWVASVIATAIAAPYLGPAAILAGLLGGYLADKFLGDSVEEIADFIIDKIWGAVIEDKKPDVVENKPTDAVSEVTKKQKDGTRLITGGILSFEGKNINFTANEMMIKASEIQINGNVNDAFGGVGAGIGDISNPTGESIKVDLTTVTTASGKTAQVNKEYAPAFQSFVKDLESTGYKINSMGGYADRANVNNPSVKSYHAFGAAIDINPDKNPNVRGQLITDMPQNIASIAAAHGLGWGGNWQSVKDPMHFSIAKGEGGSVDISRTGMVAGEVQGGAATGGKTEEPQKPQQQQMTGMRSEAAAPKPPQPPAPQQPAGLRSEAVADAVPIQKPAGLRSEAATAIPTPPAPTGFRSEAAMAPVPEPAPKPVSIPAKPAAAINNKPVPLPPERPATTSYPEVGGWKSSSAMKPPSGGSPDKTSSLDLGAPSNKLLAAYLVA